MSLKEPSASKNFDRRGDLMKNWGGSHVPCMRSTVHGYCILDGWLVSDVSTLW